MAGFGRVAFEGEFHNQKVVNVFHFRSTDWLPGAGNPFDDVYAFLGAIRDNWVTAFLANLPYGYKLNTLTGVGYDDSYTIVTPSPLVLTIDSFGTGWSGATNGAAPCSIISWRCGPQVQINGVGTSKRNRGYSAIGPVADLAVDDESHINGTLFGSLQTLGGLVMTPIVVLVPAVTLIPIIVHEKWATLLGHKVLTWRTYSDIQGYAVRRVASYRRSRQPEG